MLFIAACLHHGSVFVRYFVWHCFYLFAVFPCLAGVSVVVQDSISLKSAVSWQIMLSALTLLVGQQEGHLACENLSDGVLAWLSI